MKIGWIIEVKIQRKGVQHFLQCLLFFSANGGLRLLESQKLEYAIISHLLSASSASTRGS